MRPVPDRICGSGYKFRIQAGAASVFAEAYKDAVEFSGLLYISFPVNLHAFIIDKDMIGIVFFKR